MDSSKEYIEMCRKAVEIQEIIKDRGDYRSQGYCTKHECLLVENQDGSAICPNFHNIVKKKRDLWQLEFCEFDNWIILFYQDQLQGMLREWSRPWDNYLMILNFKQFIQKIYNKESMEQLWLAFVMLEKFNKKWDGNDWITSDRDGE